MDSNPERVVIEYFDSRFPQNHTAREVPMKSVRAKKLEQADARVFL